MIYGISGKPVPDDFPFADHFNHVGQTWQMPPLLLAAIGWRETLSVLPMDQAAVYITSDGGHGVMQLTSSYPEKWMLPYENILYACENFVAPAFDFWHRLENEQGDRLIKLTAATYNEGLTAAVAYHREGNVDAGTTNNYGAGVLAIFHSLLATGKP